MMKEAVANADTPLSVLASFLRTRDWPSCPRLAESQKTASRSSTVSRC